jgi:hypothetical protein
MAADQVKKAGAEAEARAELTDIPQINVGRAAAVPLARPAYQVLVVNADHDSGDAMYKAGSGPSRPSPVHSAGSNSYPLVGHSGQRPRDFGPSIGTTETARR